MSEVVHLCYQQLRSVVLALGGFHRLHLLYLWQLSKHPGLGSDWASFSPMIANGSKSGITRGGRRRWRILVLLQPRRLAMATIL
ncbi:hypothetical protein Q3G72_011140 [Acer saccharum]|nr:hypothetical protein Q3G72_011140 [Acer saccharum]